jgi:hypothetical protein
MRSRSLVPFVVAWVGAAAAAGTCAGSARSETIHFEYDAPASCPTEASLAHTIALDGGHVTPAPDAVPARSFRVAIVEGSGVIGRLVVRDRDGRDSTRTIRGERCEDVARSLAVLVSLALEPDAIPPAATERSAVQEPRSPPVRDARPEEPPADPGPLPPGWRVGASAEGTVWQLASQAALGFAGYVDLVHDVPGFSAFALRLGGELATSSVTYAGPGFALPGGGPPVPLDQHLGLTRRLLRLEACPVRGVASQPWSSSTIEAWACGRFDAGELEADNGPTDTQRQPWSALGPLVRVRWVDRHFFFDLEGGVTFPLLRGAFEDHSSNGSWFGQAPSVVYRVPAVLAGGGIGIGWFVL